MPLPPQYSPAEHEPSIYKAWEESGAFQPNQTALKAGKPPFVIMLPPPNITGSLHLGHALQDTIMDSLARFHRMLGEPVEWLPGTDHAALPTNKIINDQLAAEGKTRWDIGREAFQERTAAWYAKTGAEIINQMKRLGCSCDWSRQRFTMDEKYVTAVNQAFIEYFKRNYIYRGARIVNWDPKTQTTVSDLEIEWQKERTPFYYFQYGPFEIGTARPETKFGDKYVVMHPDDTRYAQYQHGQTFTAEWINGAVTATVIKDAVIDPSFGSGVMTMTPWHDTTDFEIAQRHDLLMEPIIHLDGKLLPIAGEFAGMSVSEARPLVVEKLKAKGLLNRLDEAYEHNVAVNDRGKGVIEPQVMRQWFVNMGKLNKETMAVAEQDLVQFLPPRWKEHFLTWMDNVRDWNINRQIWLGHRLPVWWKKGTHGTNDEEGNFVVSVEKPAGEYEQDPDVLDTWFSSALWPFATLGWPEATKDLATFYPTSVLVTARDILYLWVARMIFSGLELMQGEAYGNRTQGQRVPFRDVLIHPTVLNKNGQRMSKSLGTGVDPLELIEQYGADATRFGLMYQMTYDSQALKFDEQAVKSARNFGNKMWNLGRLLFERKEVGTVTIADAWMAQRTADVITEVTQLIATYRLGEAARRLHAFVWNDFADWYVEIMKTGHASTAQAKETFQVILTLLHPFMPHVTEVLWQESGGAGQLIVAPWPEVVTETRSSEAAEQMARFQDIVGTIRSVRVLLQLAPSELLEVVVTDPPLAEALATLTKITFVLKPTADFKQFPLRRGGTLAIGGAAITPTAISRAQQKLAKEASDTQAVLAKLAETLRRMEGRAPAERIAAIQLEQEQLTHHLAAIKQSQTALAD